MTVVTLIEPARADPSLSETLSVAQQRFGAIPNFVKALANNPEICKPIVDFMLESLRPGQVDWGLRELLVLKMLRATNTAYGATHHERLAHDLGVSPERIADAEGEAWRRSPHFTDAERTLLEFVEQVAADPNDVGEDLWARLNAQWRPEQIVEVSMTVTTFLMIGKMGDALGVDDPVLFAKAPR